MTFKTFLAEATILEGGAAIKGSHPLTQAEAREIGMQVVRDLKVKLNLPSTAIALVGSAGLKAPDQLSGDIDVAVEADVTLVKTAVEQLALNGQFRHMPGLNVYSFAKLHGSKVAQVDIIPTTNLKLAKWAYYNDPNDLKQGLKGSHRNELLFAIAKYAEYKVTAKAADGTETARSRLTFDLSRGLYRSTQDKAGKRGITKSYKTTGKALVTNDPDKICAVLFGTGVSAKMVMNYADAFKLMMSSKFPHKEQLPQILQRAIEGLESKKLVVPADLRQAATKPVAEAKKPVPVKDPMYKKAALAYQADLIDKLGEDFDIEIRPTANGYIFRIACNGAWVMNIDVPDDDLLPSRANVLRIRTSYAQKQCFGHCAKHAGFVWQYGQWVKRHDNRAITADPEVQVIYAHGGMSPNSPVFGRFVLRNISRFQDALKAAEVYRVEGEKQERIFEDHRSSTILHLQQLLTEVDLPQRYTLVHCDVERDALSAEISSSEYKWTLDVTFKSGATSKFPMLQLTLKADRGEYDEPIHFIIRTMQDGGLELFCNTGLLTDGDDNRQFRDWDGPLRNFVYTELLNILNEY